MARKSSREPTANDACITVLNVVSAAGPWQAGVGWNRKPPQFLKPGDVVEVEIGRIGILRNPVVDE